MKSSPGRAERLRKLTPGRIALNNLRRRLKFTWLYLAGKARWDTGITPPELVELINCIPAGSALDLGCGTGTNLVYLAARGWQVCGIDFSGEALRRARRKLKQAKLKGALLRADVTRLEALPLAGPFDLIYDIGCVHGFGEDEGTFAKYAAGLRRWLRPGGYYLLYAHQPPDGIEGARRGLRRQFVQNMLSEYFTLLKYEEGMDGERSSAWYTFLYPYR